MHVLWINKIFETVRLFLYPFVLPNFCPSNFLKWVNLDIHWYSRFASAKLNNMISDSFFHKFIAFVFRVPGCCRDFLAAIGSSAQPLKITDSSVLIAKYSPCNCHMDLKNPCYLVRWKISSLCITSTKRSCFEKKKIELLRQCYVLYFFRSVPSNADNRQPPDFLESDAGGWGLRTGADGTMLTLMEFVFLEIFGTHPLQVFEFFFFFFFAAILFRRWSSGSIEIAWRGSSPKGGGSLAFRYVISPFPVFADNRHCSVACRKPGSSVSKTAATHGFED